MTNGEQQQFNHQLAEALDAAHHPELAWDPAKSCPQGHRPTRPSIGALCPVCVDYLWAHQHEYRLAFVTKTQVLEWMDEGTGVWRFGRVPKPFHTSLDLIVKALNALGLEWRYRRYFGMESFVEVGHGELWRSKETVDAKPTTVAEALAVCAVNVLETTRAR